MPASQQYYSQVDAPFPIGQGQTISQPSTVKNMLTWLAPKQGQKVLDVGSGSGWSSALLSCLVGPDGEVFATERIIELKKFGEENCLRFGCDNVHFFMSQSQPGLAQYQPFDRILVSAAAPNSIPLSLIEQLAPDGKLVIPVANSIFEIQKNSGGDIEYTKEHSGYIFVPLIYDS